MLSHLLNQGTRLRFDKLSIHICIMKHTKVVISALITVMLLAGTTAFGKSNKAAQRMEKLIWADGVIYDTILTSTSFTAPPAHSVDRLFIFSMSGLDGQRPISDAAPGNRHYNGGRWWVHFVVFTESGLAMLDGDNDTFIDYELTSAEQVWDLEEGGYVEVTAAPVYFVCPLLKSR